MQMKHRSKAKGLLQYQQQYRVREALECTGQGEMPAAIQRKQEVGGENM